MNLQFVQPTKEKLSPLNPPNHAWSFDLQSVELRKWGNSGVNNSSSCVRHTVLTQVHYSGPHKTECHLASYSLCGFGQGTQILILRNNKSPLSHCNRRHTQGAKNGGHWLVLLPAHIKIRRRKTSWVGQSQVSHIWNEVIYLDPLPYIPKLYLLTAFILTIHPDSDLLT